MDVLWEWMQIALAMLIMLLFGALIVAWQIADWQLRARLQQRRDLPLGQVQPKTARQSERTSADDRSSAIDADTPHL